MKFLKPIFWSVLIIFIFVVGLLTYLQFGNKIKNSFSSEEKTRVEEKIVTTENKNESPAPTKPETPKEEGSILPYLLVFLLVFPFFSYACAKKNILFTFVESGNIKFVMRGNSLHKIIHDVKGYKLENNTFVRMKNDYNQKSWFNSVFGVWWIGIPPFARVLEFKIKKQKENKSGKKVGDWVSEPEETTVDSLRFIIPRPYVLTNVELKDRLSVDLLIIPIFRVVNPYIPVILLKGDFFDVVGSILESEVIDLIKEYEIGTFISKDKGAVDGVLSVLKLEKHELNTELMNQAGLVLDSISINKYDPSDSGVIEAIQERAKAKAIGEASIEAAKQAKEKQVVDAQAYAEQLDIRNKADVAAQINLANARRETITVTRESLTSPGVDPNVLTTKTSDLLKAEAVRDSKVTTWVEGGATPTIPVKGDNK